MKPTMIIIAASMFLGNAYAGDTFIQVQPQAAPKSAEAGSFFIENVPVKQHPYDYSRLNESPIRGKGRISVVHNEPAPGDPEAEITKARWLLQDNGWQVTRRR